MAQKMSRWGIGPILILFLVGYVLIMLAINRYYYPYFQIEFIPYHYLKILGVALIAIGILFYLISAVKVMQAYNADRLVTDGIYRCCRHPLYASWVVFILPGIVLLVNSWIILTTPLFAYFILRILVQKEEIYLESVFGSEYRDYKEKVPCILPYGWLNV
jgi:protein-S-isoprenylcysteine O-methyltransferase Ste14